MESTSNREHDVWMDKITRALKSFRQASQRKAIEQHGQAARTSHDHGETHGEQA